MTTSRNKIVVEGYVVVTPTLCQGDVFTWSKEDESGTFPDVYNTKKAVYNELAENMIHRLQDFIDNPEADELDWEDATVMDEDFVAWYEQFEDGTIVVHDESGHPIIETTLDEWRKNR